MKLKQGEMPGAERAHYVTMGLLIVPAVWLAYVAAVSFSIGTLLFALFGFGVVMAESGFVGRSSGQYSHVVMIGFQIRQLFTLEVVETSGASLPARSLSDGTLRFLALCILCEDIEVEGLLYMEEPENGIHPARIEAMLDLLRELSVDPSYRPSADNPMRQVLVATHSPHFVQLQEPEDLLLATVVRVKAGAAGKSTTTLRCRALHDTWRVSSDDAGVTMGHILDYLTTPTGARLRPPRQSALLDSTGVELH